jgi:transcriptional regulator with XRE-family HTH domain
MIDYWERVEKLIKEQNTTWSWLSEQIGVKQQTFSQWINKGILPRVNDGYGIAKLLNVSIDYLITGEEPEVKYYSQQATEAAEIIDVLPEEGQIIALNSVKGIASSYPQYTQGLTSFSEAENAG